MSLFIKLRGAIFALDGYCLEPPPLMKGMTASFALHDAEGRMVKVERFMGEGEDATFVHLKPYAEPTSAQAAVLAMSAHLRDALAGKSDAVRVIGDAWRLLIVHGMALKYQTEQAQSALLANFFGAKRVADALGKREKLSSFTPAQMAEEALGL